MSGQQIGTVIGGAIGAYFGGPAGAQLGMAIGGAIGGAIDPEVIKAPSIGDSQQQTSQAGVPRPVVYGHPAPFAGNIIDGEAKARKITVKERQGKGGGPIVKSERFLLTTAIRICEGPIAGVVRIWRNGEVVYDRRTVADMPAYSGGGIGGAIRYAAEIRAKTAAFQNRVRIYLGTEDQLPDPALEALHGVGNTPYYRGTAYIVIQDDDVTDTRGAAAQYQFEVMAVGTEAAAVVKVADAAAAEAGVGGGSINTVFPVGFSFAGGAKVRLVRFTASNSYMTSKPPYAPSAGPLPAGGGFTPSRAIVKDASGRVWFDSGWMGAAVQQSDLSDATAALGFPSGGIFPNNQEAIVAVPADIGTLTAYCYIPMLGAYMSGYDQFSNVQVRIHYPDPLVLPASVEVLDQLPSLLLGSDGIIYVPSWADTTELNTISAGATTLRSVAESIAIRCNVPASKINATALTADIIPGFLVAQQFSGADTLRPTQQAFFYDLPEVDGQIKAIKRGGLSAVSITVDDLLETGQDDERVRGQAIEYPLKVSVVTQDPAAEYAAIPQTSGRSSPDFEGTSEVVIQLPIPFSAAIAAQIAHKSHKVMHSMAEGRVELALPENFSRYIASDAFDYRSKRWLIEDVRYSEGECHWKAVYDRASSYGSTAAGSAPRPPELPTSGLRGPTLLAAMNLPPLREQDNVPGIYLAATGTFSGWNGCVVEMSADNGATFTTLTAITGRSVMGRLSAAITASATTIPVTLDDGELDSVTVEALAQDANAFAIIAPGDVSEIGQFQTATEGDPGAYTLTAVTRGGEGTTAAAHASGERFVMLGNSVFVPIDSALAGKTLLLRAVTNGTIPENSPTLAFVFNPVPQEIIFVGGGA